MEKKVKLNCGKKSEKNVVTVHFASDFFKCERCDYTVRMKVLGNHATCSQCGGRMHRC